MLGRSLLVGIATDLLKLVGTNTRQHSGCRPARGASIYLCPLIEGQSTDIIENGSAVEEQRLKPNAGLDD